VKENVKEGKKEKVFYVKAYTHTDVCKSCRIKKLGMQEVCHK